jgi:CheY-like chemotaxis protein
LGISLDADLILHVIGLPSMDGFQVASRLCRAGIKTTLVALTGYSQKEDIERALLAGFDAHRAKPVELA